MRVNSLLEPRPVVSVVQCRYAGRLLTAVQCINRSEAMDCPGCLRGIAVAYYKKYLPGVERKLEEGFRATDRRQYGITVAKCPVCGEMFEPGLYKVKTCSKKCGGLLSARVVKKRQAAGCY